MVTLLSAANQLKESRRKTTRQDSGTSLLPICGLTANHAGAAFHLGTRMLKNFTATNAWKYRWFLTFPVAKYCAFLCLDIVVVVVVLIVYNSGVWISQFCELIQLPGKITSHRCRSIEYTVTSQNDVKSYFALVTSGAIVILQLITYNYKLFYTTSH